MFKQKIEKIFSMNETHPRLFAIGLYLFCCVEGFGLMMIMYMIPPHPHNIAQLLGQAAGEAAIISIIPYYVIWRRCKAWRPPYYFAGLAASFILGMFGTILLGFIPLAVLVAKKPLTIK